MTPPRLLLTEPDPLRLAGLQSLLRAERPAWELCPVAANGLETVARAAELSPDLVLLPFTLAGLDGFRAALEILRRLPAAEILLILDTESPYVLLRAHRSAIRGCLLQHETATALIPALDTILCHHQFRSGGLIARCARIEAGGEDLAHLSARELEVLYLLCDGLIAKEVADRLGVSTRTVESHRTRIYRKLRVRTSVELVRYAIHHGLIDPLMKTKGL